MKVLAVSLNNHKQAFEVLIKKGRLDFPYAKADPAPSSADPIARFWIDPELGNEGFSYELESGLEGGVLVDHVLDYNEDPDYMRDLLLYNLTCDALAAMDRSPLSKREIARRLGTSPAQLYRLLDTTNYRKTVDKMLSLLRVLDREVEFVVRERTSVAGPRG